MVGLQFVPIDSFLMPEGLLAVLGDLEGLVIPAGIEVAPLTELRISSFRAGWQLPFVVRAVQRSGRLDWYDPATGMSKSGWWFRHRAGSPSELLAHVATLSVGSKIS